MAEANEMCDRLAVIDKSRLLTLGTPAWRKRRLRDEPVCSLEVAPLGNRPVGTADMIEAVPGVRQVTESGGR